MRSSVRSGTLRHGSRCGCISVNVKVECVKLLEAHWMMCEGGHETSIHSSRRGMRQNFAPTAVRRAFAPLHRSSVTINIR